MITLVEFLLARISEDEEEAHSGWSYGTPARVLAECEMKRQIIAVHTLHLTARARAEGASYESCSICDPYPPMEDLSPGPCATLRLLVLPYVDHPDFQEKWKP